MAAVAQGYFFNRTFGNLRQKSSHALRQNDVGLHLGIFFRRNRGHVHRILYDSVLQIFPDLSRNLYAHSFLRFESLSADVRRENYIRHGQQGRLLQRLFGENIECGRSHVTLFQGLGQIGLVHQLSARAIHQADAFFHLLDGGLVNHARGLRREAHVQSDVIRRRIDLIEARQADALLLGDAH